jgi:DNA ligase-associated metallophosphoesterase
VAAVQELVVGQTRLRLLPEKAVYVEALGALLVSDVHLGKAETFQHYGFPVPSLVNQTTLGRLQTLCRQWAIADLWILGDLFHHQAGLTDGVRHQWLTFLEATGVTAHLILGNHDRRLQSSLAPWAVDCCLDAVALGDLMLSHEPATEGDTVNVCGHLHPCLRLTLGGDRLRLPCFHWQPRHHRLTLPAFGDFTGGYDIRLGPGEVAYTVADDAVVAFAQ